MRPGRPATRAAYDHDMPATGEWCAPTAELSASQLGRLVDETRRDTAIIRALKPTDDPPPPPERASATWSAGAQRRPCEVMRKTGAVALARPVVYPTAPRSRPGWLVPAFALLACIAIATAYLLV